MTRISRNISVILRTERLIAKRRLAVLQTQSGLMAVALVAAGVGLVMLNVAAFFALRTQTSPQISALIIALINLALALLLLVIASRMSARRELEPVTELRDLAMAELEADLQDTMGEARELADDIRKIARDPLGSLLPSVVVPILASFVKRDKS